MVCIKGPITDKWLELKLSQFLFLWKFRGSFKCPLFSQHKCETSICKWQHNVITELYWALLFIFSMQICLHSPPDGTGQNIVLPWCRCKWITHNIYLANWNTYYMFTLGHLTQSDFPRCDRTFNVCQLYQVWDIAHSHNHNSTGYHPVLLKVHKRLWCMPNNFLLGEYSVCLLILSSANYRFS